MPNEREVSWSVQTEEEPGDQPRSGGLDLFDGVDRVDGPDDGGDATSAWLGASSPTLLDGFESTPLDGIESTLPGLDRSRPWDRLDGRSGRIALAVVGLLAALAAGVAVFAFGGGGDDGVLVAVDETGNTSPLDGATIVGPTHVSLDPGIETSSVRFFVGPEPADEWLIRTDDEAPFNLAEDAGGASQAFDFTSLGDGEHTVWISYRSDDGWHDVAHDVTVGDPGAASALSATGDALGGDDVADPAEPAPADAAADPASSDTETAAVAAADPAGADDATPDDDAGAVAGAEVAADGTTGTGTATETPADPATDPNGARTDNGERSTGANADETSDAPAPAVVVGPEASPSTTAAAGAPTVAREPLVVDPGQPATTSGNTTTTRGATTSQPATTARPATTVPTGSASSVGPDDVVVSPTGSGSGSVGDPASLAATLRSNSIAPGTTIWLRGGTYRGPIDSMSNGTQSQPIVIRSYPGERAVIEGRNGSTDNYTVNIDGDWQTWMDLEITNSDPSRFLNGTSRPLNVYIVGRGTTLINNSIHEGGGCIGWWKSATDSLIYGNLIYNCGWDAPDRGHGHGLYIQNLDSGRKRMEHNLIGPTYGRSINVFGSDTVHNLDIVDNVVAGGESLADEKKSPVYIAANADDLVFSGNHVYSLFKEPVSLVEGTSIRFDDNWLMTRNQAGALGGLWVRYTNQVRGRGNHIAAAGTNQLRVEPGAGLLSWDANTYYGSDQFLPGSGLAGWSSSSGHDGSSRVVSGLPDRVVVMANRYDDDRGLVTIWNGAGASRVDVDVSSILEPGDRYQVLGGQDLGGQPVLSGTYSGGTLSFPLTGRSVGSPAGGSAPTPWGTEFGAFAIVRG